MLIGTKKRQIDIFKPTTVVDGANDPEGDDPWVLHRTRWAEVKGETGMAVIRGAASAGGVMTDIARYSFRVNFDLSIDTTMQVRDRAGNRFDIVGVRHDLAGRKDTWIVADTGASNG